MRSMRLSEFLEVRPSLKHAGLTGSATKKLCCLHYGDNKVYISGLDNKVFYDELIPARCAWVFDSIQEANAFLNSF